VTYDRLLVPVADVDCVLGNSDNSCVCRLCTRRFARISASKGFVEHSTLMMKGNCGLE
jgi:hypothetical protein